MVINEGNSDNLGDQAIKKSLEYIIKDCLNQNYNFEDLSRYKKTNNFYFGGKNNLKKSKPNSSKLYKTLVTFLLRFIWITRNFYRINKAVKSNDYAIIGGGQLLLANNIFPFEVFIWTIFLKIYNIKYSFFSVGTEGKFSKLDIFFLKNALTGAEKLYVRDQLSKDLINKNFNINSILTYDTAFMYNKIQNLNYNFKTKFILLGIVDIEVYRAKKNDFIAEDEYHQLWFELIKSYDIKNVKLFYSTNNDKSECIKFQKFITKKSGFKIDILENTNLKMFIKNIKKAKLVISGRMHSLILAKTFKVDYITFEVSDKLAEFEKIYKNLEIGFIQDDIIKKIKLIFQN